MTGHRELCNLHIMKNLLVRFVLRILFYNCVVAKLNSNNLLKVKPFLFEGSVITVINGGSVWNPGLSLPLVVKGGSDSKTATATL